jgi:multiple sugar transport system substrate-binding protein
LTAALAANTPPTMSQVYEEWATQYQQNNDLVDLTPYINGGNGLSQADISDFYPSLWKDGQINGKQYMLPFNKSDEVLYYNAEALAAAGMSVPTTWDAFEADLTKVTKADGSQWGLSITPDVDAWSILYKSLGGGNFVSADGKSAEFANSKNTPFATQALGMLQPLVKSGAIHITTSYNYEDDFAAGKSVFAITTIASYPFLKPTGTPFTVSEAEMPAGPAGKFTVLFGTNLSIFQGTSSDDQAAAWDFIKYVTSDAGQESFVQATGYMPVRQSAFNSSSLQSYYQQVPARKVGNESLPFAFVESTVPAWDSCRTEISTDFAAVLTSQISSSDGLTKMASACNADLAQG